MVAFMCSENNNPFSLASMISLSKNAMSAFTDICVASTISPFSTLTLSFKMVVFPALLTSEMDKDPSFFMVTESSFDLKSP